MINFDGIFYQDGNYVTKIFDIIDTATLDKKTGVITIRFNQDYIDQINESKFYKYIDFNKYKTFTKATAARLYEILTKSFLAKEDWEINLQILG